MSEIVILIVLSFIIFASPFIAKLIKIPIAPTEILLGMVAGSLGLFSHNELFKLVADIGFYYLMFLAGTEVDLKIFIRTDRAILKKSLIFTVLMYLFATLITYIFGLSPLFIVIFPLISIGILSTLYKDYGKKEEWLNLAMLVGVIGEIVSIALLTVLSAYLKHGFGSSLFINLGVLVLLLITVSLLFKGLEVLFWWYPGIKRVLMPQYDKDEKDIRLSMALFCFVIAIMIIIDLKVVLGAFIAGTFISTFFDHKKDLPNKLSGFGFGFLIPIFFAYVGSTIEIDSLFLPGVISQIAMIVGAIIVIRILSAVVFLKNLKFIPTILFALSLSMPLTLLIAVATIGIETGYITQKTYYSFVFASLFEVVICLVLIKLIHKRKGLKNA